MFFIIEGRDGTDPEAGLRRQAARDEHLAIAQEMKAAGTLHFAAAYIDDDGNMTGSMLVFEVESEQDIEAYLAREPYVLGNVWKTVAIRPCKIPPFILE